MKNQMPATWNDPDSWQWYALKIAPGRELAAERILADDGFDVFIPLQHKRTARGYIALPRYRGYVFIGFCGDDVPWLTVMRFAMILGVVSRGGKPVALPMRQVFKLASHAQRPLRVSKLLGRRRRKVRLADSVILNGPYQFRQIREIRCIEADRESEREIGEILPPLAEWDLLPYKPASDEHGNKSVEQDSHVPRLETQLADDSILCPGFVA